MAISVKNVRKSFGDFTALDNVSLDIKSGELVALLGPSGSGKTTLLRIIAGLETPDSGDVMLDNKLTTDKHVRDRNVGFVFQHYALFKHMTVFENVAFGLRVRSKKHRPSERQIRRRVLTLLKLVRLEGLHGRYPSQLSGGQRQRVALARALAVEPRVLLLDEPFGALDARVRKELRRWMRRLHDEMPITSVFVTHDQEEAMEVADRVVVMSNGRIEQVGTPDEVWNHPQNSFVYDFLGNYNIFDGWKDKTGNVHIADYDVLSVKPSKTQEISNNLWHRYPAVTKLLQRVIPSFSKQDMTEEADEDSFYNMEDKKNSRLPELKEGEEAVRIFARPHEMFIAREPDEFEYISATVSHVNPAGPLVKVELERRNGSLLQAEISSEAMKVLQLKRGEDVLVRPKKTRLFETAEA